MPKPERAGSTARAAPSSPRAARPDALARTAGARPRVPAGCRQRGERPRTGQPSPRRTWRPARIGRFVGLFARWAFGTPNLRPDGERVGAELRALGMDVRRIELLDSEGGRFWDPAADGACFDTIKRALRPGIQVIELDNNINDPAFSAKAAETLLGLLQ